MNCQLTKQASSTKWVGCYAFSTVNDQQMNLFQQITGWWHPNGPMHMLHLYNYERIKFLRKNLKQEPHDLKPFNGMTVLDVGCGAGFLSESLCRLGAKVKALDPNLTSYSEAKSHKGERSDLKQLEYINISVQDFLAKNEESNFDLVTSMEVIQHVDSPQKFMHSLSQCCKPNGIVMISTIRRSLATWITHIVLAEKVARVVPEGTHHYDKFLTPQQCKQMMYKVDLQPIDFVQLGVNWKGKFQQRQNGGNYLIMGRKKSKSNQ